jgi:uncharacterized protein (TIGR00369 family)
MTVPAGLCEADGTASAGCLAVLVDSTLGTAAATQRGGELGVVTLGMHFDLGRVLPRRDSVITVSADAGAAEDSLALAIGVISDSDGVLGYASWRGAFVAFAGHHARLKSRIADTAVEGDRAPAQSAFASDVDQTFSVEARVAGDNAVEISAASPVEFASGWGTLHGGAVALVAHRAAYHAAHTLTSGGSTPRPVSVEAEFFRPLPCSAVRVLGTGRVVNHSRSYLAAEGTLRTGDGRLAAVVRTTETRG